VIPFHRVLIATAIVFCAFMAAWAGWRWRVDGSTATLALAAAFAVATLALAYYLRHLSRFLGGGR
jgi:hypothetical protein